jgi:hypothetical protein
MRRYRTFLGVRSLTPQVPLPQRLLARAALHPRVTSRFRWDLSSSLEIHQRSPLRCPERLASTPGRTKARPSMPDCHIRHSFRPCRSTRLRRFPPQCAARVYCTSLPAMGFAVFPVVRSARTFPDGAYPSKLFPSQQRFRCRHRPCPLAVASRARSAVLPRRPLPLEPRPQGFVPLRSPLHLRRVSASMMPDAPLGFPLGHQSKALQAAP